MPHIAPEVVQKAERMDLLTYLKNYGPFELVHFPGNTYTTKRQQKIASSNCSGEKLLCQFGITEFFRCIFPHIYQGYGYRHIRRIVGQFIPLYSFNFRL